MMITGVLMSDSLYVYLKENNKARLAIALFAPLSGLALKINITNLRSAFVEYYSSGIYVCAFSTLLLRDCDYFSNFAS